MCPACRQVLRAEPRSGHPAPSVIGRVPPADALLYQVNTRIWLTELGVRLGRAATLDDVPDAWLDRLGSDGFDWLWLLGVWQTGEAGRRASLTERPLAEAYAAALPDVRSEDVCGSPFAVRDYTVHEDFGGPAALARFRARLTARGVRLMLDFVPNHTALDHPWARAHPEFYVHGTAGDLARAPHDYCAVDTRHGPRVLAHGRDPHFPGWRDTLQLNLRHGGARAAMQAVLGSIAEQCDGLRCDMAMLLLPEVIARTWGASSRPADGSEPIDEPFWPAAIGRVRAVHPRFVFLAEVYWDLETALQQQGFDYAYDKGLYDRLRALDARAVRDRLRAPVDTQRRAARFLENHDEARAAAVFPPPVHRAAAVLTLLAPGLRFVHQGQRSGRRRPASVHLRRRAGEPVDEALRAFYARLLACARRPEVRDGQWRLLEPAPAWDGNPTWEHFVVSCWEGGGGRLLVAVNYGPVRGQCHVGLPLDGPRPGAVVLRDLLDPAVTYVRDADALARRGLYLDMPEWGHHVFEVRPPNLPTTG